MPDNRFKAGRPAAIRSPGIAYCAAACCGASGSVGSPVQARSGGDNSSDEAQLVAGDLNDTTGDAMGAYARPGNGYPTLEHSF